MSEAKKPFYQYAKQAEKLVESVAQSGPIGSIAQPVTRSLYGINHRQQPAALPMNKDIHGLTFFTRPQLNLSRDNIKHDRLLAQLLVKEPYHLNNYIRSMLDPKLQRGLNQDEGALDSPLCDARQAFIPLLTNTIETSSGWRDTMTYSYTSPDGLMKEAYGFVDGPSKDYTAYDIQASFRNVIGDPVTDMFFIWCHYMSLVATDVLAPYPEFLLDFEYDSNTRIYRFSMDSTKRFVTAINATGASYPISSPTGATGNFERASPYNRSNDMISLSFRSFGALTRDPILVEEFNATTYLFNPNMAPAVRDRFYRRIPHYALDMFNHAGYPFLDPDTMELQWFVEYDYFDSILPFETQDQIENAAASTSIYVPE